MRMERSKKIVDWYKKGEDRLRSTEVTDCSVKYEMKEEISEKEKIDVKDIVTFRVRNKK